MKITDFYNKLSELYPTSLSASWDNDGLMICPCKENEVNKVLCTLDVTRDAIDYAIENGFDTILSHHPMIFKGIKSLNELSVKGDNTLACIKNNISVISLHTRLDAGDGGVNDTLATLLKLENITPFGDEDTPTLGRVGTVPEISAKELAAKLKDIFKLKAVNCYISGKAVQKIAICGGGGNDFIATALAAGADTYICGELHYNSALDAAADGLNIFELGHYASELPVCLRLKELAEKTANAKAEIYEIKSFTQL